MAEVKADDNNNNNNILTFNLWPKLQSYPKAWIQQLKINGNYMESHNALGFCAINRKGIVQSGGAWAPNISLIKRRLESTANLEEFIEAKVDVSLARPYCHMHNARGFADFIETHISKAVADEVIPTISWFEIKTHKNKHNMNEVKSITIFFKTAPDQAPLLIERLDRFENKVLANPLVRDKIIEYYWHPFEMHQLPYKFIFRTPNLSALIAANITDPKTTIDATQFILANVPLASPYNCSYVFKVNPKTGQLNLRNAYISTNYLPWNFGNNRVTEVSGLIIGSRKWTELKATVKIIRAPTQFVNKKAMIKNDGLRDKWNNSLRNIRQIQLIAHKIVDEGVCAYNTEKINKHKFELVQQRIETLFKVEQIHNCTTEMIIRYGLHNELWTVKKALWSGDLELEFTFKIKPTNQSSMHIDNIGNSVDNTVMFPHTYKSIKDLKLQCVGYMNSNSSGGSNNKNNNNNKGSQNNGGRRS
eukprot:523808_1